MQVDAIKQRTGHLGLLIGGATRRAGAGKPRISQMSTFAGVHRSDKLHTRRKSHMSVGTRHSDLAPFQWPAQAITDRALEFWQLIQRSKELRIGQNEDSMS